MMAETLNHIIRALKKLTLRYAYFFTYQESIFLGNPLKHIDLSVGGTSSAKKEMEKKAENAMRNFALRDRMENEIGVFTRKPPRQAALKAANRGYTDIQLRERETKKVHIFTGERVQMDKPKGAPDWMPDKIWKPKVKKMGIKKLEEL